MAWQGLGVSAGQPYGSWFEFNAATHRDISRPFLRFISRFPRIRIIRDQSSSTSSVANRLWALDLKAYKPSIFIHYGIANAGLVYLPTFYTSFLIKMLDEAQWAQDNGMDEFQVANEFEQSGELGSLTLTSLTRTSNVVTAVAPTPHGLSTGDTVVIQGASPSDMNVNQTSATVIDAYTFTYPAVGANGTATGTKLLRPGNLTIIRFVKMLAAEAQAVFTRGPITYSVSQGYQTNWFGVGITPGVDLDRLDLDLYGQNSFDTFMSDATAMWNVFGTLMGISEFNLHSAWGSVSIDGRTPSMKEFDRFYAYEIGRRYRALRALGLQHIYFFSGWNASASENNAFTAFLNSNQVTGNGGALIGDWKKVYDELLEEGNHEHVVLGTQQHT